MPDPSPSAVRKAIAECIGTYLLVFFGCGVVHTAVLTGAQQGLWQVAVVWGLGIMLAIFVVGAVSGAHLNPAMTLAFAAWRRFPLRLVPMYLGGQLAGSILAAATLYILFLPWIQAREWKKDVTRGEPGSVITAMCYGEYFPNPGSLASGDSPYDPEQHAALKSLVPTNLAFAVELVGTAVLALVVFAVTDPRNSGRPAAGFAPVFIGLAVAALISVLAPLTQACFNPARDFGPRLFASFMGWGEVAWPGMSDLNWLTVYIVAPILGAFTGGGMFHVLLRPALDTAEATG